MASNEALNELALEEENNVNLDNSFGLGAGTTFETGEADAEALAEQSTAEQVNLSASGEEFGETAQQGDGATALPCQVIARAFFEILESNAMSDQATQWRDTDKDCPL